jgi:isocitrate lyase
LNNKIQISGQVLATDLNQIDEDATDKDEHEDPMVTQKISKLIKQVRNAKLI